jgi:hypothetical protein
MQTHCNASKRSAHVINLDPAAEHFNYEMSLGTPPFAPAGGQLQRYRLWQTFVT